MKKSVLVLSLTVLFLLTASLQAAFIVEPHSSGLASDHFSHNGPTAPSGSTPSGAPGLTATNSVFGGSATDELDTYTFSYTPGADTDNWEVPADNRYFGNGLYSTNLAGGESGYYNVYITWPASTGVSSLCDITVTNDGDDVVWNDINMNTDQTIWLAALWGPFPEGTVLSGGTNKWLKIADQVMLTAGQTYTVNQVAQSNTYVSLRSAGVMWEFVAPIPEPATLALLGLGALALRRKNR